MSIDGESYFESDPKFIEARFTELGTDLSTNGGYDADGQFREGKFLQFIAFGNRYYQNELKAIPRDERNIEDYYAFEKIAKVFERAANEGRANWIEKAFAAHEVLDPTESLISIFRMKHMLEEQEIDIPEELPDGTKVPEIEFSSDTNMLEEHQTAQNWRNIYRECLQRAKHQLSNVDIETVRLQLARLEAAIGIDGAFDDESRFKQETFQQYLILGKQYYEKRNVEDELYRLNQKTSVRERLKDLRYVDAAEAILRTYIRDAFFGGPVQKAQVCEELKNRSSVRIGVAQIDPTLIEAIHDEKKRVKNWGEAEKEFLKRQNSGD